LTNSKILKDFEKSPTFIIGQTGEAVEITVSFAQYANLTDFYKNGIFSWRFNGLPI